MALQDGRSDAPWKPPLSAALRGLADLILPPRSLSGPELVQVSGLPPEAWSRIRFLEDPVCDGCGAPFEHQAVDLCCAACLARPRAFARARAACVYDEASRDLILRLKHADRTDLAGLFTAWLSRAAADLIAEPMPWSPCRCIPGACSSAATTSPPRSPARSRRDMALPTSPTH